MCKLQPVTQPCSTGLRQHPRALPLNLQQDLQSLRICKEGPWVRGQLWRIVMFSAGLPHLLDGCHLLFRGKAEAGLLTDKRGGIVFTLPSAQQQPQRQHEPAFSHETQATALVEAAVCSTAADIADAGPPTMSLPPVCVAHTSCNELCRSSDARQPHCHRCTVIIMPAFEAFNHDKLGVQSTTPARAEM